MLVAGGSANCHWSPTVCGAGEVTVIQLPGARFVDDCNVNPVDAIGHEKTKFEPFCEMIKLGGAWGAALASTLAALSPAMFVAVTT